MDLMGAINVSASGMSAQTARMKVLSENIANADSITGNNGGAYRRKQVFFKAELDRATGLTKVAVDRIKEDKQTPLKLVFEPANPLADERGYVAYPNVDTLVESTDMRQATRAYEANLQAIESAKEMMARSLDLIR
ncbi:MAG: flagellar basal body rod protein FlgC [Alphaproteobacteria bacterium]